MSDELAERAAGFAEAAHVGPGMLDHGDDRAPLGVHWRVLPGPGRLLVGPVVVRDWPNSLDVRAFPVVTDRSRLPAEVSPDAPLTITVTRVAGRMAGWVLVRGGGRLRVAVVAPTTAPNGAPIEITARDQEPWFVASADIEQVRVTGEGVVEEIVVWDTSRDARETLGRDGVLDIASLDAGLAEALGLYAPPLAGAEGPEDRVRRVAPTLPTPYSPRRPWPEWNDGDEVDRVTKLVGRPDSVVDWLRLAFDAAASGRATGAQIEREIGGEQVIRYPALSALGIAAADPGVARWLARCGMLERPSPRWADLEPSMAVAMAPVLRRVTRLRSVRLPRVLDATEELYDEMLGGGYRLLLDRVQGIPAPPQRGFGRRPRDDGGLPMLGDGRESPTRTVWDVDLLQLPMPLVLEAAPAIPLSPRLRTIGAAWVVSAEVDGPDAGRTVGWEGTTAVGGVAHFGPVSFVRRGLAAGDPDFATMHDHAPGSAVASPMLLAWPEPKPPGTAPINDATLRGRVPVASPAEAEAVRWEVALGDWTGRWGDPVTLDASPPTPARPAPPTIRAVFVRTAVAGSSPASPGAVRVEIEVSRPSAPGALPLEALALSVDGVSVPVALPDLDSAVTRIAQVRQVPPSMPGDTRRLRFEAWVVDTSGVESDRATAEAQADDGRAVPSPVVAPRLLVGGRPGPAPDVAVRLTVRSVRGAAYYRFYTAAETTVRARVGLPTGSAFRAQPRAQRAKELLDRGRPPREGFTLADTAPVDPATRTATGVLSLPSATSDIVVVRAVPVTAGVDAYGKPAEGVEASVADVDTAYLIVPSDEAPPLPRVTAVADGPGRATVSVEVSGAPAAIFGRLPGPIEARIVEAIDGEDPHYWPEVARVPLTPVGGGGDGDAPGRFAASLPMDVPPWARLRLAASVRYAAEPTVLPGADLVDDPDLTAGGPQPDLVVAPWGALGAPVTVDVPGAEPSIRSEPDGTGLRVVVDDLPTVREGASPFTAIVYTASVGGALLESERHEVTGESDRFVVADAGGATASEVAVVLKDPFGRSRAPRLLE